VLSAAPLDLGALRLMLVTDDRGDAHRLTTLVERALIGGVTAVQLREPSMGAGALFELCQRLAPACAARGAVLLVNDRVDVAVAAGAHGVHLPSRGLRVAAARQLAKGGSLIVGRAAHDPAELAAAAAEGADYATLSPVFATPCKPGARGLGVDQAAAWTRAVGLPVVWLGGITVAQAANLPGDPHVGVAVRSAICDAEDPAAAAAAIVQQLDRARGAAQDGSSREL